MALPQGQYASGKKCWKHLDVACKSLANNFCVTGDLRLIPTTDKGKHVDVTVVDLCPGCGPNDIDLSEGAFKKLASLGTGRIQVTWNVKGGLQLLDMDEITTLPGEVEPEAMEVGFPSTFANTGDGA